MKRNARGRWAESVIASFTADNNDGDAINAPMLADDSGTLYGTAEAGGPNACGVLFRLEPTASGTWTYTQLYAFRGGISDGCFPAGPLIRDRNGALYGTTLGGGLAWYPLLQNGVVYRLSPPAHGSGPWTEKVLYEFKASSSNSDGRIPWSGVMIDPRGGLLGTTSEGGGSTNCGYGCGTVFRLVQTSQKPETWTEHVIHRFRRSRRQPALVCRLDVRFRRRSLWRDRSAGRGLERNVLRHNLSARTHEQS